MNCTCKTPYYVYNTYSICLNCNEQIKIPHMNTLDKKYELIGGIVFSMKEFKNINIQRKKKINKIKNKIKKL